MLKRILTIAVLFLFFTACSGSKKSTLNKSPTYFEKNPKPAATASKPPIKNNPPKKSTESTESKAELKLNPDKEDNKELYKVIDSWLGTPHKLGGCSQTGIDCSCFAIQIYRDVYGIDLRRRSSEMINDVTLVNKENLTEGDLLFFKIGGKNINHVGIYLKNNQFVHSSTSKGVIISNLNEEYWVKYYYAAGHHKLVK